MPKIDTMALRQRKMSPSTWVKTQRKGLDEVKYAEQVPYIILIDYPKWNNQEVFALRSWTHFNEELLEWFREKCLHYQSLRRLQIGEFIIQNIITKLKVCWCIEISKLWVLRCCGFLFRCFQNWHFDLLSISSTFLPQIESKFTVVRLRMTNYIMLLLLYDCGDRKLLYHYWYR